MQPNLWHKGLAWLAALLIAGAAQAQDVIKIGSTGGSTSAALEALVPEAKAAGLDIKIVEFTDWTLPNEAVSNGDIDLNFFQHQAFLNNAVKERGYKLEFVSLGLLQNIGIYSNKVKSLDKVPQQAKVGIPNDPVNQGRGLLLLQKAGLIKLKNGSAVGASVNDVIENPKKLQFFEIAGPQLIRSLDDLDLSIVWPSYFKNAGKPEQASQALLYSGIADTFYAMGFVARTDKAKDPRIARFVQLYQNSPKVREAIASQFNNDPKLYTLPWKQQ